MYKNYHRHNYKPIWIIGLLGVQIFLLNSIVFAQNNIVNGTVTDYETGNTLPGVNITVKGTTIGTATDANGEYQLAVPSLADTLVFSFIGFTTQTVPIDGRTDIDIALAPQALVGEELVVVGYGTQRRKDVTGSVASVPVEDLQSTSVTGFDEVMTGKVAGVQVNTVSGVPGGGPTIRIRGIGSIGAGNDPLYVVDGFPIPNSPDQRSNPLNSIAPSQIESIEVLKDASATAIYGSRGANGVVLITTRRGTPSTQIQVNSSASLQNVRKRGREEVLNAREFAQFMNDRISDNIRFKEGKEPTEQDIPEMYRNPEQYGEGTNWPDEILQNNALMHNHNFSVSGGNESIRSSVTLNLLDQQGTLLETNYRRYNLRANINANLSKRLKIGVSITPSLENQKLAPTDGDEGRAGAVGSAFLVNPIAPVKNPDGSLTPMVDGPGLLAYVNPVLKLKEVDHTLRTGRAMVNTYAEFELVRGLNLKSTFNVDWRDQKRERYEPTTVGRAFNIYPPDIAEGLYNTFEALNWLNENTVNYHTDFGLDHRINTVAGFSLQKETIVSGYFNARDFPDDEIRTFNAAPNITGSTNASEWSLISTLARINYEYKGKYLFTGTLRMDGSSRFGSENRWGTFPSLSIGWRASEENFMDQVEQIDNLLLRVGYGRSGNFNIGNYTHLGLVGSSNYALNSLEVSGRSITNLGNPNLGWEEVDQLNIGLDLGMLEDRFNISADYYNKITASMLLNIETPITSGFSNAQVNRGEVQNEGIELAINSMIVYSSSFSWNADFNISHNSNKVTELDSRILSPASTAEHITEEGYPVGQFFGFQVIGFYEDQEDIDKSPQQDGAIPGGYKFKDVNGDGRIDAVEDFTRLGDPYPDFTWGLTNSLNYNNFDLSISVTGSYGGETLQAAGEDFYNMDGVFNVHKDVINRWRSPDDPGDGKQPRAISTVIHRYMYSPWVEDNSNIWIRNITLGYTFDPGQFEFLNSVDDLRVYMNVKNAWISNVNFQNPEAALNANNPLQPGHNRNVNYPISRVFTLGININL